MEIKQASLEELKEIESVLREAAGRIKKTGSSQWAHVLVGEEREHLEKLLSTGSVYKVLIQQQLAAVFYLSTEQNTWDKELWLDYPSSNQTYYLHKLALKNGFTGQGLGNKILQHLQSELEEDPNPITLRLDCISSQPYLNKLYSSSKFSHVGTINEKRSGDIVANFNLYEWQNR